METKFSHFEFYSQLRRHKISLTCQGMISQDILSLIGLSLKRKADNEVLAKRLFGIVVELAQNIFHYSAIKHFSEKDKRMVGVGIVTIGETPEHYVVTSGNMVDNRNTEALGQRCAYINTLDEEGLKKFYKNQRSLPLPPEKTGGNIGLIDLARRSGNPLGYEITPVNDLHSFFTLSIKIRKEL